MTTLNGWAPPGWARAAAWAVREVGAPLTVLFLVAAAMFGWVDTPLLHLHRLPAIQRELEAHERAATTLQAELIRSFEKQRCLTAISVITQSRDTIITAALSRDPCAILESMASR
jgi:hypothetical protein